MELSGRGFRKVLGGALLPVLAVGVALSQESEPAESSLRARAAALHRDALVVDAHNDVTTFLLDYDFDLGMDGSGTEKRDATLYWVRALHWILPEPSPEELRMDTDLRRLRDGGVDAQFFSIFVDSHFVPSDASEAGRSKRRALDMIEAVREQVRRHPEDLALATSTAELRAAVAGGRIAALMGIEGGHAIEADLENLSEFHALGVRYMTLTWNNANAWADSCYEERHGGLTDFGREVVREMNRLGMMVDISHVSDAVFADALETTRAPVIASHSSARALVDHPRNLSDDMLRAVASNGGVVMINFQEPFIDPEKGSSIPRALWHLVSNFGYEHSPLSLVADHVEHVVRVAGEDHVGLGSDFAGSFAMPEGLRDVSGFPNLTEELLRRGWSEPALSKFLGGNLMRVFAEVEAVSDRRWP